MREVSLGESPHVWRVNASVLTNCIRIEISYSDGELVLLTAGKMLKLRLEPSKIADDPEDDQLQIEGFLSVPEMEALLG